MFSRVIKSALSVPLAAIALLAGTVASGQSVQTIQTLDRVDVYNKTKVLEMEFDDPGRTFDFTALDVTPTSAAGFAACQVTANQALYCIDGTNVVYWATPSQVVAPNTGGQLLFPCTDPALGLDTLSSKPCTGLTVDLSGAIWLAGKKPQSASYNLLKVIATPGTGCPVGWSALQPPAQFCAKTYAINSRQVVDLTAIDGDVGAAFAGPGGVSGPGVLGLASDAPEPSGLSYRRTVVFFRDDPASAPTPIASGAVKWGLASNEQLQSVSLLQFSVQAGIRNFVLASTNLGRILAVDALGTSDAFEVFNIVAERTASPTFPNPAPCNALSQQYGLRASSKSGRVYLTDRNYCQAVALESVVAGNSFQLRNVQEGGDDLTFSTTAAYPPDAGTIAPGVVVGLSTCGAECTLLSTPDGQPAARLFGVKLASTQSGMTLFQVKDIPDCRWNPLACAGKSNVVVDRDGNIVPLSDPRLGTLAANSLYLNVTPLMPLEITSLFDSSGVPPKGLPRMLISPQYRAQEQADFLFEALFGITEAGVVFKDTFTGEFDVQRLAGQELSNYNPAYPAYVKGCGRDYAESLKPNRRWDVVTTVSEKVVTAGGPDSFDGPPSPNHHVDTLLNTGCVNPTKTAGDRWSMYAYNLEIAPNTDAVFAKLLTSLYDDLDETAHELACEAYHTGASVPVLGSSVCSNLSKQWATGKTYLSKCVVAATKPKKSADVTKYCASFLSQVGKYQTTLNSTTISGPDPDNRLGELKARTQVIQYVYKEYFLPNIPANGFTYR